MTNFKRFLFGCLFVAFLFVGVYFLIDHTKDEGISTWESPATPNANIDPLVIPTDPQAPYLKFEDGNFEFKAAEPKGFILSPEDVYEPIASLSFGSGEEIGVLSWKDGKLTFEGNADEAAKVFFEYYIKNLVDEYIRANCGEEKWN